MARFGLQLPDFGHLTSDPATTMSRLTEFAQAADLSGYSSLWVMDHFFQLPPLGGPKRPILEGYVTLGALAAVTSKVQLGTLVTGVTYRNPGMLAKMITTLDVLSGGRAILGIGAAWYDVEHTGLGFEFPPLKQRFEMLVEAVEICRLMFTEQNPSYTGSHFSLHEAANVPGPIRSTGIPIMIGGSGEQKTLRLVAKYADQCNIVGEADTIRRRNDLIDSYCAEVDRNPAEVFRTRMAALFPCATEADATSLRQMFNLENNPDARAQFTIGTRAQIIDEVRGLIAAGLDEVIFSLPGVTDPAVIAEAGDILAEAVR
jgi:F420-dependent oxidoreductase-like protein